MARKQNDDLLIEDELAAAFLTDEDLQHTGSDEAAQAPKSTNQSADDNWDDGEEEFPGQLAVDFYESEDGLVVKAGSAGANK